MSRLDLALRDFVDALETADDDVGFKFAADRFADRLGYRWFAYVGFSEPTLKVLYSYPGSWAREYLKNRYQHIDPVIGVAKSSRRLFQWNRRTWQLRSASQQRFFSAAADFGIRYGATVPIFGGFGRFAAFTLATDLDEGLRDLAPEAVDTVQLAGLYYHAHVYAKLQLGLPCVSAAPLTQRERQCLVWAARGKKMPETAKILGVSTRTVVFHIENARSKLGVATVAQAVAEAWQRGLIAR
ncbi:LuxR family transcriptional regulator [Mesorhizobium sp.]|uniref:LuxR family transcriptional regulator n=1 Tax=Mesorhizobium sp. TaxID=1871066 RepID=UPI000FE6A997|nr:LuxR family transcriptional regulator [Mesorhizobium sp.]RWJ31951.1 MAG: LuxR family transcriptional regulator [Mesorhizobium sp.]TIQ73843.1 MAG: hypothetical protein E5X40_05530 [Mesorhizobium sp.]